MNVYTCVRDLEAMLTCIYYAWSSGLGHKNIRLELEPVEQLTLFDEYTHIDADPAIADKVASSIVTKISPGFYNELTYTSMAYESDILDNMYRVMILGFHFGPSVLSMLQYRDIMRHREIRTRLGNETCRFQEVTRFHEVKKGLYVAHIEPKSHIIVSLGPIFEDRMPSEHWMIVDDVHKVAVIHPKDEHYFIRTLTEGEFDELLKTEEANDEFTDLWKVFFDAIAIKERINPKLQMNLLPLWTRKHAVEFT